jgi:hypothetical protein
LCLAGKSGSKKWALLSVTIRTLGIVFMVGGTTLAAANWRALGAGR